MEAVAGAPGVLGKFPLSTPLRFESPREKLSKDFPAQVFLPSARPPAPLPGQTFSHLSLGTPHKPALPVPTMGMDLL